MGKHLISKRKMGGGAYSQTVGMTIGALFFATIMYVFTQPALTMTILIVGFISGLFWALGQVNQLKQLKTRRFNYCNNFYWYATCCNFYLWGYRFP